MIAQKEVVLRARVPPERGACILEGMQVSSLGFWKETSMIAYVAADWPWVPTCLPKRDSRCVCE